MEHKNKNDDVKEDFCPPCLAVPLLFAASGAGIKGKVDQDKMNSENPNEVKKWLNGWYIAGVIFLFIAAGLIVYKKIACKTCK